VEFYLLESFDTTGQYYFQIDETSVISKSEPLLTYSDLISYNAISFTFKITEAAKAKIKDLDHSVFGLAFAVKANRELIYTGYFWPCYSSASCDWLVIDPCFVYGDENEMQVSLGYPGLLQGVVIPDNRNDPRILAFFRNDNKLIE
jgi:hypothetical protein